MVGRAGAGERSCALSPGHGHSGHSAMPARSGPSRARLRWHSSASACGPQSPPHCHRGWTTAPPGLRALTVGGDCQFYCRLELRAPEHHRGLGRGTGAQRAGADGSHPVGAARNRAAGARRMGRAHRKGIPGDAESVPGRNGGRREQQAAPGPRGTRAGWQERKQMTEGPLAISESGKTLVCSEKISGRTVAWTGSGSGRETPREL